MHKKTLSIVLSLILTIITTGCSLQPKTSIKNIDDLRRQRETAKFRTRRIIMNNDGNDFSLQTEKDLENPKAFLDKRTSGLIDSQADSIFYCTGVFNVYSNTMKESEYWPPNRMNPKLLRQMEHKGVDPLKIMTDFCHDNSKEIFWSMRMNDTHDAGEKRRDLLSKWKRNHPQCLVAGREDRKKFPYGNGRWSSLDYENPLVRDKVFRILSEICTRYDIDGIELDFCRHLILFKNQIWGRDVTDEQRNLVTDLIRRIRHMTEQQGLRRGRPILIAVRIPDSADFCKAVGIDLEHWLDENLIDVVSGGYVFCLEPWQNLVALGKKYNVPVYACFEDRRIEQKENTAGKISLPAWRGEAWLAWQAGVNGIYTFNQFDPKNPIFREIGDPKILETLDRIDHKNYVNEMLYSRPEVWLKNGRSYLKNTDQFADMRQQREQAKHRRRRIIFNNDGNDCYNKDNDPKTAEQFLKYRTAGLVGTQVDSIFYCDGVFNLYSHGSSALNLGLPETRKPETEILKWDKTGRSDWAWQLKQLTGKDNLEIMADFCRNNNIEIFWSMRMNDTHDAREEDLFADWKRRNPQYLIGEKNQKFPYGGRRWSSVNYDIPEVREKIVRIFRDVCTRYDIDGIEMDFFRHPILFKDQMVNGRATDQQRQTLTEWLRTVRRMTEDVAVWRNRPILIAVRVPDSIGYCNAIGIDLQKWLDEGLIDIVTGGGYFRLEPWKNLVALGRQHDVPVYACFEHSQLPFPGDSPDTLLRRWRGESLNAWNAGISGIYTFNLFDPTSPVFREVGDPSLLKTLPRIDRTVFVNERLYSKPEDWIKDGRSYLKIDDQLEHIRLDRKKAARRKRRIIMNNDGNDCLNRDDAEPTVENFLKRRTTGLENTQVDTICYCDGVFNLYCRRSKESDPYEFKNGKKLWAWDIIEKTRKDPLDWVIDFGDQHNIEVFWSMRMNDTHDHKAKNADLFCDWKRRNPQYLMGKIDDTFHYGGNRWSAVNYELPDVRDKVFRIFRDVCTNHNVDGIELDFYRHLIYFKQEMFGDQPTADQREMMTQLMRRIRIMTEYIGAWRGRPILIAVRVPVSMEFAKNEIGLDVQQWLDEGLVDILIGGSYFLLEPWENLVATGQKYDVPVYACLSQSRIEWAGITMSDEERQRLGARMDDKYPDLINNATSIQELMHNEARLAWNAGADGIYTFNIFNPNDPSFRELGSPDTLIPIEQPRKLIVGWPDDWLDIWFKNWRPYLKLSR